MKKSLKSLLELPRFHDNRPITATLKFDDQRNEFTILDKELPPGRGYEYFYEINLARHHPKLSTLINNGNNLFEVVLIPISIGHRKGRTKDNEVVFEVSAVISAKNVQVEILKQDISLPVRNHSEKKDIDLGL